VLLKRVEFEIVKDNKWQAIHEATGISVGQATLIFYLRYFRFDDTKFLIEKMSYCRNYNLHIWKLEKVRIWLERRWPS